MILGAEKIFEKINNGVIARLKQQRLLTAVLGIDKNMWKYGYMHDYINNMIKIPLITNIPDDFEVEGTSADLRLDKVFERDPNSYVYLGTKKRNTGESKEIQPLYEEEGEPAFIIKPMVPYIGVTAEEVNLPLGFAAKPLPRVTNFSAGVFISFGLVNPGYYGPLKFGFINLNTTPIFIAKNFRMITVTFETIEGNVNAYEGFHQSGDKITTQGTYAPPR